jgi:nucleoside 2-deoxyribosyltransferase
MTVRQKLYLAGPEVFFPHAAEIGAAKQTLCADYDFIGLYPLDGARDAVATAERLDEAIYRANVAMIHSADAGVFNLSPFHGPSADAGTVFELGLMTGLGKPCFAYTNVGGSLLARVQRDGRARFDEARRTWVDHAGNAIEDFGGFDNLMIVHALAGQRSDRFVSPADDETRSSDDLSGFIECLERLRRYFG